MAFPVSQPPADWSAETLHWGGALSVTRGLRSGTFFRDLALSRNAECYFKHHLGDEFGMRALSFFQWALCVYGAGDHTGKVASAPPCPDPEVAAVLRQQHGCWYLPTLCVDADGLINTWAGGPEDKEEIAFLLSLMRCAQMLFACDNAPIELKISTRRKQREAQALVPWPATIVEDSGWATRQRGNCYREFDRTVKFERPLDAAEVDAFKAKWFATERSPGWGDPNITTADNQTFQLRTAVDSSD